LTDAIGACGAIVPGLQWVGAAGDVAWDAVFDTHETVGGIDRVVRDRPQRNLYREVGSDIGDWEIWGDIGRAFGSEADDEDGDAQVYPATGTVRPITVSVT
jgi:hypothetical protein